MWKMSAAVAIAVGHGLFILAVSAPRTSFPSSDPVIEVVLVRSFAGRGRHAGSASSSASKSVFSGPLESESTARPSDLTDQDAVTLMPGGQSEGRTAQSDPGFHELSPWTVAPSEKYNPDKLGRELDCSTSNDASVWRNRSRACHDQTTPPQTETLRDRHETVVTDRARSVKLKP